jgi:hypothetical protein
VAFLKEARGEKHAARDAWQEASALYQAAGIDTGIEEAKPGSLHCPLDFRPALKNLSARHPHASE